MSEKRVMRARGTLLFQFERTVIGDWSHFRSDWKLVLTQNFVIRLEKADIDALLVMIGGILLMIGAKCVQ